MTKLKKVIVKNKKAKKIIDINTFEAPSYEKIKELITKRIGTLPKIPNNLPKGDWTEQSLKVLEERYLMKDKELKPIETPEDMLWRVSWEVASAESRWGATKKDVVKIASEFYELMVAKKFLPNSPTLMNAGTGNGLQYSACFVLPVEDSMEGIFDALKYQAIIHKTGGGTGFSFSRLRESGSIVKTSSGTASGPISFMRIFDASTNEVKQGGKRRGANMGILRVDHPNILDFIHCKEEGGITNFNISVALTDAFMKAYDEGKDYDLISPKTKTVVGSLSAKLVFDQIADGAYRTGDPGLVFIDKMNKSTANPVPSIGAIEATNPCGEQPLYPFDACNLGSIFLTYFVKDGEVDWEKLKDVTRTSVRFLDDVIEVNPYPLKQVRNMVFAIRRIGLGIGGWADMLIELGIPYDSEEAIILAEKIMKTIQDEAELETEKLAKIRGAFPLFDSSIYKNKNQRRNSTVTTIAPTGSISIIAGASSGIEPLFAVAYQHIVKDKHLNRKLSFVNPKFEEITKNEGVWTKELMEKVGELGVVREITELPQRIKDIFGTAHEITPEWHIKTQNAFQKYTENAVSKTINLRHDATINDIKKVYLDAWNSNCKGITVFRDGCKDEQVLNLGINEKEKEVIKEDEEPLRKRPYVVRGSTYRLNTPVGTAFITINEDDDGQPLEIFINVGKAGSDVAAMAEALGRTISTTLKFKGNISAKDKAREIAEQLAGIGGRRSIGFGPTKIRSLPDAIAGAISVHYNLGINGYHNSPNIFGGNQSNGNIVSEVIATAPHVDEEQQESLFLQASKDKVGDICPSCGASALVFEEGCSKCHACGHSEC